VKYLPFFPTRVCLKNGFPGESINMAQHIIIVIGIAIIMPDAPKNISTRRLKKSDLLKKINPLSVSMVL
jgi:hypothetical protein